MKVAISWSAGSVIAELNNTPTTQALAACLPIESRANIWGEEIYFDTPVRISREPDARQVVEPGTVCFWVEGNALCLPWGPTPISHGDECRLISEVNILGKIMGDPHELDSVKSGETIRVEVTDL